MACCLAVFLHQALVKHPQNLLDRGFHYPLLQTLGGREEIHYVLWRYLSLSPLGERQLGGRKESFSDAVISQEKVGAVTPGAVMETHQGIMVGF